LSTKNAFTCYSSSDVLSNNMFGSRDVAEKLLKVTKNTHKPKPSYGNTWISRILMHYVDLIWWQPNRLVVYRSSETSTNQSDVIIRSDDRFLNLVVDSDSIYKVDK
jgi:hypothetical protein